MAETGIPQSEPQCKHEVDLALMAKSLELNTQATTKILDILEGNGKPGVKTEIAVQKSHTTRIYLWLAGLTAAVGGIVGLK